MQNFYLRVLFCFILVNQLYNSVLQSNPIPEGFIETLIAENLDPTDMVIAPDGRVFITIKSGQIRVVENDQLLEGAFLDISLQIDNYNERGLGHIVLDPDFETNNYYYIYYTVKNQSRNRISRFTANGNATIPGSEVILLDLDPVAGSIHNGGAMVFGNDGMLYVATGDGGVGSVSQSMSKLLGKVLRINPYGENEDERIPDDNPFVNDPEVEGVYEFIYALGFRNPFTMDIDPVTGLIYVNDVGGGLYEEINRLEERQNYGWPITEGFLTDQNPPQNYQDPIYAYTRGGGIDAGCAITGAAFYNFEQFPEQSYPEIYRGKYFFADYCNGYIRVLDPNSESLLPEAFIENINRPITIRVAPDGSLYYLARAGSRTIDEQDNTSSTNGSLWKVSYTGSGTPNIGIQPQSLLVSVGENATFTVRASGSSPLNYQWQMNSIDIPGTDSASFSYNNAQITDSGKEFRCKVSNEFGEVFSEVAILEVSTNRRPELQIATTLPNNVTFYQAGQLLEFSGEAIDPEDGILAPESLAWKIDFHHDDHTHPALSWTSGIQSGSYFIPRVGETSDNVWYRIYFRATDQQGFSNSIYTDIYPEKTQITLISDPPGIPVNLDGKQIITPHTFTSVVGVTRALNTPPSLRHNGKFNLFETWNDSIIDPTYVFNTPLEITEFKAKFSEFDLGEGIGLTGQYYNNQFKTFEGEPTLVRNDSVVDFDWGRKSSPGPNIATDTFTVRWEGTILPVLSDTYTFYLNGDDGYRLWVNDQLIIDQWVNQVVTEVSGTIDLEANIKYLITVEYYERKDVSIIELRWSSPKILKEIIPQSQLFPKIITSVENPKPVDFMLYPNPSTKDLFVKFEGQESLSWSIYNTRGISVLEGKNKHSFKAQIDQLTPGVYFFKVHTPFESVTRFIKE